MTQLQFLYAFLDIDNNFYNVYAVKMALIFSKQDSKSCKGHIDLMFKFSGSIAGMNNESIHGTSNQVCLFFVYFRGRNKSCDITVDLNFHLGDTNISPPPQIPQHSVTDPWNGIRILLFTFNAVPDPDPNVQIVLFDSDPDLDPDPGPYQSDANLGPTIHRSSTAPF
jgi:hypothetical protein